MKVLLIAFFADGAETGIIKDHLIYAELDKDMLTALRNKFPFLADQDNFHLEV